MSTFTASHAFRIAVLTDDYHNKALSAKAHQVAQSLLAVAANHRRVPTIADVQSLARKDLQDMLATLDFLWESEDCILAQTAQEERMAEILTAGMEVVLFFRNKLLPEDVKKVPGRAWQTSR